MTIDHPARVRLLDGTFIDADIYGGLVELIQRAYSVVVDDDDHVYFVPELPDDCAWAYVSSPMTVLRVLADLAGENATIH